ncbi:MAG: hypothetical protein WD079_06955, partial [Phycisphaeraceae bacterium]
PAKMKTVTTAVGDLTTRLHEWLGAEGPAEAPWLPPVAVLTHAACRAQQTLGETDAKLIVWIGRAVWPYPAVLDEKAIAASIWVEPRDMAERARAVEQALRSPAVAAVVADGSGLSFAVTRRLQLAAEAGRALAMLARPMREISSRSAAAYRWRVDVAEAINGYPRWRVERIRSKDAAESYGKRMTSQACFVEWHHAQGLVAVPAVVADRADRPTRRSA